MKIIPLPGRVLVRPDPDPESTAAGIYKPHKARARHAVMAGTVVHPGIGTWRCAKGHAHRVDTELEDGSRILFNRIHGEKVDVNGDELRLLEYDDVLCVVTGDFHGMDVDDIRTSS